MNKLTKICILLIITLSSIHSTKPTWNLCPNAPTKIIFDSVEVEFEPPKLGIQWNGKVSKKKKQKK
jgi:hypothetical protein